MFLYDKHTGAIFISEIEKYDFMCWCDFYFYLNIQPSFALCRTMAVWIQKTNFTNPSKHLFHIPQCSIQNRNVQISVLNGALWDMEQVHSGICELHISVLNGALWDMEHVYSGICELGQMQGTKDKTHYKLISNYLLQWYVIFAPIVAHNPSE